MNLRPLSITVAVLVLACVAVWFARRPAPPVSADPRVGQPVLAPELATQAARVKLSDQGKIVELARGADGSWTVPSYHDFPADFGKLSRLVSDLTAANIRRLVTARPDRLSRLEFKDTTITLADNAGAELWRVTLGKNADGGGRYLRYDDEEKGYLANLSLWIDAEPKNWADSLLLDLKTDTIARVELSFPDDTTLAVNRAKKEDPWTIAAPSAEPEGKRLKGDRIDSLLANFSNLRFTDTTAPDDAQAVAARAQRRTIKLTTFDGKSYTIGVGRKPEEKKPKEVSSAAAAAPPAESEPASGATGPAGATDAEAEKPKEPEFETIPAGPVFVSIDTSDESAAINRLMQKRAFQINEWPFTSLPATTDELWEDRPSAPEPTASNETAPPPKKE